MGQALLTAVLQRILRSRVEERRGGLGPAASLRFLSPLTEPDVPICRIGNQRFAHIAIVTRSCSPETTVPDSSVHGVSLRHRASLCSTCSHGEGGALWPPVLL